MNPSYIFAAEYYLSRKSLQNNINISYRRGIKTQTSGGKFSYNLKDGFSVFNKMTRTPASHQKNRFEGFLMGRF